MEHFRAPAQTFGKRFGADRHNHEFLNVNGVGRVRAAVEYVHHRNGQTRCRTAADKTVKRNIKCLRSRFRRGNGNRENCVCAELGFVIRAVCVEHNFVYFVSIESVNAFKRFVDNGIYVGNRFGYALAAVTRLVAVAQLDCLELARGRTGGRRASAYNAAFQFDFSFDCGIAARVYNFSADNFFDFQFRHNYSLKSIW